jgi:aryl-alcohol dehydrogenase-like predicted oxidoreductase
MINTARYYYQNLDEERIRRIFKTKDSVLVPSQTLGKQFAFSITDEDYLSKAAIMNDLTLMLKNLDSKFVNLRYVTLDIRRLSGVSKRRSQKQYHSMR